MFKKIIYTDKYEELMKEFKHIAEDNVPYTYKRTNYDGWTTLLDKIKSPECEKMKMGNLSYFVNAQISVEKDGTMKVFFNLTDETADEKYTDDYYRIELCSNENTKCRTFSKIEQNSDAKLNEEFIRVWLLGCDFGWYKNHFVVVFREDDTCGGLYGVLMFGDNASETLNEFIGEENLFVKSESLLVDLKYVYDEKTFEEQDNTKLLKTIVKAFDNACKVKDYDVFKSYVEDNVVYSNTSLCGFDDENGVQDLFKKLTNCKETKVFKNYVESNKILLYVKCKLEDGRTKNNVIEMKVNSNEKVYYAYEVDTFLYNIPEFDD